MKKADKSKIGIISLGCPRNLVDSESILGRFRLKDYQVVDIQDADIGIVNTCAFIKEAKEESIETILDLIDLKKQGRLKKIIVYGCFPQRYKGELASHLKEIDAFVGRVSLKEDKIEKAFSLTPPHYAYIKISEGCRNLCSYCIIPTIKGAFTSREPASIINQVRGLDKQGCSEINIIGQDITSYGSDLSESINLVNLLKEIVRIAKNIKWIRLLYTHPAHINDELIDFIAAEPNICKYIDLPIQHINDKILKRMNRHITKQGISQLLKKIRERIPCVAIRTSIIVGFPGETKKDFTELLDFISKQKFERLGAFIYSKEEGTSAYNFKGQVPKKIKLERMDKLMLLQQETSAGINKTFLNKEIEVLIDEPGDSDNIYLGRSQFDAPEVDGNVYVRSKNKLKLGDFVKVRVNDTLEYDLVGEQIFSTDNTR